MASKHQLSLELPDTNNIKVLRIFDTSLYSDLVPVKCGVLEITSPGFNAPVQIEVTPNFNLVLNACTLGLQASGCGEHSLPIPDGIYHIRYSVSPNDKVYVEYDYLRVSQTLNKYFNQLGDIELSACEPTADLKAQLAELRLIKSFIDAAKVMVEIKHNLSAGMELLVYAQKRLQRFTNSCSFSC